MSRLVKHIRKNASQVAVVGHGDVLRLRKRTFIPTYCITGDV